MEFDHYITFQKIECLLTSSEMDGVDADFLASVVKHLGMKATEKPDAVYGHETHEEYENRKEAVSDWEESVKAMQKPGKTRDQLYIKLGDIKVWPSSDKYREINSGQTIDINVKLPWPKMLRAVTLTLMEWDHVKDDTLGDFTVSLSDFNESPSRQIVKTVMSKQEGSLYKVYFQLGDKES